MDRYYIKKEWQKKMVILGTIYFLSIIFFNIFFISSTTKKLGEVEKQKTIFAQEQRFFNIVQSIPEESKNFVYEIKKSLEEKRQFFQIIETISKSIGIKVKEIQEIQVSQDENINTKMYSLNFLSSFKKIGEFILLLEKQPNIVIKRLNVSSGRKEPIHNVEVQVEVYDIN